MAGAVSAQLVTGRTYYDASMQPNEWASFRFLIGFVAASWLALGIVLKVLS